jgi:hypothetical protein
MISKYMTIFILIFFLFFAGVIIGYNYAKLGCLYKEKQMQELIISLKSKQDVINFKTQKQTITNEKKIELQKNENNNSIASSSDHHICNDSFVLKYNKLIQLQYAYGTSNPIRDP